MDKHDPLEQWVHMRMGSADVPPAWPDTAAAWSALNQRAVRRHRLWLWAGAIGATCAIVFAIPGARLLAQRVWDQIMVGRIQVITTDGDQAGAAVGLFSPEMRQTPEPQAVRSLAEAVERAGFSPRLPGADVLDGAPAYSLVDPMTGRLPLRTGAIREVLSRSGGSPRDVPDAWNGVVLEAKVGPVLIADYSGVRLLQSLPFRLTTPPDFDLRRFYRVAFQSLGLSLDEARDLSGDLFMSPALLMFMPKEDRALMHEFDTESGTGMMIEEVYGRGKTVALWSGSDRLYALFADTRVLTRDLVRTVANALD